MIVTEIILPYFSLMDPHEFSYGSQHLHANLHAYFYVRFVKTWENCLLITRLLETFHSICIKMTATFIEENRVLYQRRTLNYDIGICYAELLAQAIATLVGYFSYPPIVNLALFAFAFDTL